MTVARLSMFCTAVLDWVFIAIMAVISILKSLQNRNIPSADTSLRELPIDFESYRSLCVAWYLMALIRKM